MKLWMQLLALKGMDKCVKYKHPHRGQVGKTGISQSLWDKTAIDWLPKATDDRTISSLSFPAKFFPSPSGSGIL